MTVVLIILQILILAGFVFWGFKTKIAIEFLLGKFIDQIQKLNTNNISALKALGGEIKEIKSFNKSLQEVKEEIKSFQNSNRTLLTTSQTLNSEGNRNFKNIDSSVKRLDLAIKNLDATAKIILNGKPNK